jgi:tRNA-modifying protein YgfZ
MLCPLQDRSLLRICGEETKGFLQSIITNNVMLLDTQPALFSALLSPQGKLLHDFFLLADPVDANALLLETHDVQMQGLMKLLMMYRLRAKITFALLPEWQVYARFAEHDNALGEVAFTDPRHPELGCRIYAREAFLHGTGDMQAYEIHRLRIGIPDGVKDAVAGRSFPLEMGYDKLHAVDFSKGCYVGQEVTARSKFRATLRKGLYHVYGESTLPEAGTEIVSAAGIPIGEMRSSYEKIGLAMVRHEAFDEAMAHGAAIFAGDHTPVVVTPLAWTE